MNIQNLTQRQFDLTLKREGIIVQDYYDSTKTYNVFFRRNNRGNSPQGKLRMFYAQDSGLNIGSIFTLKGNTYVIISQDANESDIYYTSIAMRCDTTFGVNGVIIPFVVVSDKFITTHTNTVSLKSGSVVIYTGLSNAVRKMQVNDYYENFGNAYNVGNIFINDNIYYVYLEQTEKRTNPYTLTYNGVTSIDMTSTPTYQLSYIAKNNGTVITDSVTLTYSVTPTNIATVSDTGLLTLLKEGTVTVTATWTEQNISCITNIVVNDSGATPTENVSVSILGNTNLKIGYPRIYTAKFTDKDGSTVDYTDWHWNIISAFTDKIIQTTVDTYKLQLKVDDENLIGKSFYLQIIKTSDSSALAETQIEVVELM